MPTARKVPATAPVLLKKPVGPASFSVFKLDPGDPTIVVAWTVRYVVDPVMVTREVIVLGAPSAPVVGMVVVMTSVTGAVTVLEIVVVAVTSSVDA